ncbi:MAG: 1-deoxy-D-xylulose-5-phosphate reductoisomerase [Elusimicrobia bacterium]|nr:1-deoxy-D-xylulose-5-phosphate reductoisomerase [Elusimicrobiota bacterium]
MKNLIILGSTGSIGVNALRVVEEMGGAFRVLGLSAYSNVELLQNQVRKFKPEVVSVFDPAASRDFKRRVNAAVRHLEPGVEGLCEMVSRKDVDVVLLSLVGGVGFAPFLAALKSGKTVALANKEPMVMAGAQFMIEARRWGARILPVDSEPSAVFQCLETRPVPKGGLRDYGALIGRVFLTASGGAFYRYRGDLSRVSVRQALAHPTWKMGRKITIDCATLMNKGFETIEIMNLFGLALGQIRIVIHPQSIMHSAVEFKDGSILAQMGHPDMKLPIQYALTWPDRARRVVEPLDFESAPSLTFAPPDFQRFPCLGLAFEAARAGGSMPAVLSAADEVAVSAFVDGRIRFTDIPRVVERTMKRHRSTSGLASFAEVVEVDGWAREKAAELVEQL